MEARLSWYVRIVFFLAAIGLMGPNAIVSIGLLGTILVAWGWRKRTGRLRFVTDDLRRSTPAE